MMESQNGGSQSLNHFIKKKKKERMVFFRNTTLDFLYVTKLTVFGS